MHYTLLSPKAVAIVLLVMWGPQMKKKQHKSLDRESNLGPPVAEPRVLAIVLHKSLDRESNLEPPVAEPRVLAIVLRGSQLPNSLSFYLIYLRME